MSERSKSRGRSKYPGKFVKVCWRCGKQGDYKKDYISKIPKRRKGSEDASSLEAKITSNVGDVYLASSIIHVYHEAWPVESGASFHMTAHKECLCAYEKYDGGDVFLGDDSIGRIIR